MPGHTMTVDTTWLQLGITNYLIHKGTSETIKQLSPQSGTQISDVQ